MSYRYVREDVDRVGFVKLESVFTEEELAQAESILDELMLGTGKFVRRFRREMADKTPGSQLFQPELYRPALLSKALRKSPVYEKCRMIAAEMFGRKTHYLFDHAIYKMPQNATETPWHQDQAYLGEQIRIRSLHFWIPFQDTSAANGTMRFVENSHRSLLPHGPVLKHNPNLLGVMSVPEQLIHELSFRKGDLSIHTNMTLHGAGANGSKGVRKAWIIHFSERPAWYKHWLQATSALSKPKKSLFRNR